MIIHYKNKHNPKYPHTACGRDGIRLAFSENIKDVTCSQCLFVNDDIDIKGNHERNQLNFKRDGVHGRLW